MKKNEKNETKAREIKDAKLKDLRGGALAKVTKVALGNQTFSL